MGFWVNVFGNGKAAGIFKGTRADAGEETGPTGLPPDRAAREGVQERGEEGGERGAPRPSRNEAAAKCRQAPADALQFDIRPLLGPEDIGAIQEHGPEDLTAVVVLRKAETQMRTPAEAKRCLQWLEMALEERWRPGVIPRHRTSERADDPAYRRTALKEILEDANYPGGSIRVDDAFLREHTVFELESKILGNPHFCLALFRRSGV